LLVAYIWVQVRPHLQLLALHQLLASTMELLSGPDR
jgi:hypothetical protein